MTDQEIIIEVAKLDGWQPTEQEWQAVRTMNEMFGDGYMTEPPKPKYLTSRDAIIPVIEKQDKKIVGRVMGICMQETAWSLLSSPKQLCIALLKATEKWKE